MSKDDLGSIPRRPTKINFKQVEHKMIEIDDEFLRAQKLIKSLPDNAYDWMIILIWLGILWKNMMKQWVLSLKSFNMRIFQLYFS